ncbi:hypothetical protein ACFRKE_35135, partial [Kitasatospora indigofera]|uniref:hypothetical protein n=1 Tax=Kitasatospora indigofera TaxID=67307 RepID=UPI0036C4E9BE
GGGGARADRRHGGRLPDASQRARWTSDGQNWWQVPLLTAALLAPGAIVALVRLALARPGGARR